MSNSEEEAILVFDEEMTTRLLAEWHRTAQPGIAALRVTSRESVQQKQLGVVLGSQNFSRLTRVRSAKLLNSQGQTYVILESLDRVTLTEAEALADDFIVALETALGASDRNEARAKVRKDSRKGDRYVNRGGGRMQG